MAASEAAKRKKAEVRRPDVCVCVCVCVCVHARTHVHLHSGPQLCRLPCIASRGRLTARCQWRRNPRVYTAALVFPVCQEEALAQAKQTSLFQHKRASRTADTEPLFSGRVGGGYGYGGGLGGGALFGGGPLFGR